MFRLKRFELILETKAPRNVTISILYRFSRVPFTLRNFRRSFNVPLRRRYVLRRKPRDRHPGHRQGRRGHRRRGHQRPMGQRVRTDLRRRTFQFAAHLDVASSARSRGSSVLLEAARRRRRLYAGASRLHPATKSSDDLRRAVVFAGRDVDAAIGRNRRSRRRWKRRRRVRQRRWN